MIIVSINSREGKGSNAKKEIFSQTFGKFPNCKIKIYIFPHGYKEKTEDYNQQRESSKRSPRWKLIQKDFPDFDMFIDDNYYYIEEAKKNILDNNKIYVLPDYKCNRNTRGSNVYHVKNDVSDLKNQDFAIASLELKTKKLQEQLKDIQQQREREREREQSIEWLELG